VSAGRPPGDAPAASDGFGPVDYAPLSRIQQIGGARLHAAWTQIPHVTHFEDADVSAAEAERKRLNAGGSGPKLTLLAWVARAAVLALGEFPRFCASLDVEQRRLVLKRYVNLGIAVEAPAGLVVGIITGADRLDLAGLAAAIGDLAERGRAGRLKPSEMEGSCFTISSLGNLGGTGFTPIINPPDVAILGVSPARLRPEWVDGRVEPRLVMPLSLSYDHRVINGADAARFCTFIRERLALPAPLPPT
jgi:pyruvate dehydrogenase E2 component (dihydrolipoamide acetyltransferase)